MRHLHRLAPPFVHNLLHNLFDKRLHTPARGVLLAPIVLCALAGCLQSSEAGPAQASTASELRSSNADPLADPDAAALEPATTFDVPACFPENHCGPEFSCPIEFDEDCDPQFCRLTGNQCKQDGGFGTFQRNEHVKYCWNAAGEFCIDADHGRYLVHCGC